MYQTEPPLKQCGRIQIVPYQHEHFKELVVRPHDDTVKAAVKLSDTQWADAIGREAIEAYTCYLDGKILLIGGINILWDGVGEVWVIGSPQIPSLRFSYIKICKFYLKYVREK